MAISINPITHVITVPQSDLTFISGTLYQHDTEAFRLQLIEWESSDEGIWQPNTHIHNTEVAVAGVTYARTIQLLAPYTLQYEDLGHPGYTVMLVGSNNNLFEAGIIITNHNSVISTNSAGLIVKTVGSGVTVQDKIDIAELSRQEMDTNSTELAAIKSKTDNLPASPASVSDIPSANDNADAVWNKTLP